MKKKDIIFKALFSFTILTFLNWVLISLILSFKYINFIIYSLGFITNTFIIVQIGETSKKIFNKPLPRLLFFIGIIASVIILGYYIGYLKMELIKF